MISTFTYRKEGQIRVLHARLFEQADIADRSLHDLRRTMGSWQAGTGANLSVIGRSLNHKSKQTTAIYARLWMEPVRSSMGTAAAAMLLAAGLSNNSDAEAENATE